METLDLETLALLDTLEADVDAEALDFDPDEVLSRSAAWTVRTYEQRTAWARAARKAG